MIEEFVEMCRWMTPYNKPAFEAYIKGKAEWPEGTRYDRDRYKDEIGDEFGGPNDALAMRIMTAVARSMEIGKMANYKGGIRALAAIGVPLEKVIETRIYQSHWSGGYDAARYYDAAPFVDVNIKRLAEGNAKPLDDKMYGIYVSMAIALLEKDQKEYVRYIPAIEAFVKKTFDRDDAEDTVVEKHISDDEWEDWYIQREKVRTACFVFDKGAGALSPALQKLELRMMLNVGHCGITKSTTPPQADGVCCSRKVFDSGYIPLVPPQGAGVCTLRNESKDNQIETAKRLKLPPEWFELWELCYKIADDHEKVEHLKKLFAENRPLFDKVHRAYYSPWDGIPADDTIHPRTRKSFFKYSFALLFIKLINGTGQEECSPSGELEDLKKNWAQYLPAEKLRKDGLPWSYGFLPYALLYEYGIEPLDALFTRYFVTEDSDEHYRHIKNFFYERRDWDFKISLVNTFIAKKHGSLEDIFFARAKHPDDKEQIPPLVIHEIIAAYPDESRAAIAKVVKECKPEEVFAVVEAAFAKAGSDSKAGSRDSPSASEAVSGFPLTEALVLLNSSSKKVLDAAQELFFNHEAEIRPEIEARLPKLKKAAYRLSAKR